MIVTFIAIGTALLSAYLVLSGLGAVARDTAQVLAGSLARRGTRLSGLAFGALWLMIFALAVA